MTSANASDLGVGASSAGNELVSLVSES
jgi:hypothetical protein